MDHSQHVYLAWALCAFILWGALLVGIATDKLFGPLDARKDFYWWWIAPLIMILPAVGTALLVGYVL